MAPQWRRVIDNKFSSQAQFCMHNVVQYCHVWPVNCQSSLLCHLLISTPLARSLNCDFICEMLVKKLMKDWFVVWFVIHVGN